MQLDLTAATVLKVSISGLAAQYDSVSQIS